MALPTVQLDEIYRDVILDHYRSPRGRTELPHCDCRNEGLNPTCGDEISLCVAFSGEKVDRVHADCRGCSISVASASMMAELLPGRTKAEVQELLTAFKSMMHGESVPEGMEIGDLDALQGVQKFPVRVKCALLAWTTLEDALKADGDGTSAPSTTEDS